MHPPATSHSARLCSLCESATKAQLAPLHVRLPQVGEVQGPLTDGWGLTTDGTYLIATDSSTTLYFFNPDTMQVWVATLAWHAGLHLGLLPSPTLP